jgi:ABC-type lipoprotein release transport system permease subunit
MQTLKLALRNILGAGLRTWLNVTALSFSFVVIVFLQGFYQGMNDQVERATVDALYGGGQYWQERYDPYDPLTLGDSHAVIPPKLQALVSEHAAAPILIHLASIYPEGRYQTVLLKGIDPSQDVSSIPSSLLKLSTGLKGGDAGIPALIGSRMANSTGLKKGDEITVQWRDVHGTFDARDVTIVDVFRTTVQEIDNEQIWIPLGRLQQLTGMPGQATIVVLKKNLQPAGKVSGWEFKSLDYLLSDLRALVRSKTTGASILYLVLLFLAMLAIFDTQVLSIFHRRKEMGTLMALGMTRTRLIGLFTLEGALHGVLAALLATVYGIPLLGYVARAGWELPEAIDRVGFAIGERLFPIYSPALILGTTLLVLIVTTIVSYLPTRKIARLKPTDALRGRAS